MKKVLSVNVGLPRFVEYEDVRVETGIFKEPVEGRVKVGAVNIAGDGQADLEAHGGQRKAVYFYPSEHYEFWHEELPEMELPFGIFGENLTTAGLFESDVRVGDLLRIGTTEFAVTGPRFPCFKFGIRFGRKDIIRRFAKSLRCGFYASIEKTGELGAGDAIEIISSAASNEQTITEVFHSFLPKLMNATNESAD